MFSWRSLRTRLLSVPIYHCWACIQFRMEHWTIYKNQHVVMWTPMWAHFENKINSGIIMIKDVSVSVHKVYEDHKKTAFKSCVADDTKLCNFLDCGNCCQKANVGQTSIPLESKWNTEIMNQWPQQKMETVFIVILSK